MISRSFLVVAGLLLVSCSNINVASASFLDYFIPQRQGNLDLQLMDNENHAQINSRNIHVATDSLSGNELEALPSIPYELTSSDEKFLQEAAKLIGSPMSDLDICHHRVVMKLRKSCHELNAEQLGKLAVMLLNCQSISEGRSWFECTETMSLKDCTHGMDSDTWNAYHLVTNRAKAVCVASRQEQFRGLTELTVNKLMHSGEFHALHAVTIQIQIIQYFHFCSARTNLNDEHIVTEPR